MDNIVLRELADRLAYLPQTNLLSLKEHSRACGTTDDIHIEVMGLKEAKE